MDQLLTVPQAAERLGCSRWTIYSLVNTGKLARHYMTGRGTKPRLRISDRDVQAYIDSIKAPSLPKTRESAA